MTPISPHKSNLQDPTRTRKKGAEIENGGVLDVKGQCWWPVGGGDDGRKQALEYPNTQM
ncbi:hypothetical protein FA13DRAFT_1740379 [Coprinellus micaceus]|uniref:Uncharacterized protein n=1 Tax=Coprinellus micaceus TaxID=71717 RepID=A0A4Y7SMG5_COPMI|nr:hypothetical protein FA13DRAFT_1740379 [Coprinellus micaceus]